MKHLINIIDAHVAGEPLRLITGGLLLKGSTLLEKREYMMKHYDFVRSAAMLEPRGHADMYGAVLTAPTDPQADWALSLLTPHSTTICADMVQLPSVLLRWRPA